MTATLAAVLAQFRRHSLANYSAEVHLDPQFLSAPRDFFLDAVAYGLFFTFPFFGGA